MDFLLPPNIFLEASKHANTELQLILQHRDLLKKKKKLLLLQFASKLLKTS